MAGYGSTGRSPYRRRRRWGALAWVGIGCLVAVLVEVGVVTNGFGLLNPAPAAPPAPGPNPNPYGELIGKVLAAIIYNGQGPDPFPSLNGGELCVHCPELPKTNTSYNPPVAGIWFYFNVTNGGSNGTTISNFTLKTSGSDTSLFKLVGVVCCYPHYAETTASLYFTPGQTFGLGAYAYATLVPYDGPVGYNLTLHLTSP
jgi:hypothetical protein